VGLPRLAAAEPPPEVRTIRFVLDPTICLAPMYVAEPLLHMEGFSSVEYVDPGEELGLNLVGAGRADIAFWDAMSSLYVLDAGTPVVTLAGIHAGCWQLIGNERIRAIRDLKGKKVAVSKMGDTDHMVVSIMLAYVGIDPRKELDIVFTGSYDAPIQLFLDGKADAFIASPPKPQELRAKKIGHVIVDSLEDRPWFQYFCCMVEASRTFVTQYPTATKRALRALLKASDLCAQNPGQAARLLVDKGHEPRYDIALEVLRGIPYRRWRDADPEDSLRFFGLRLHEVGIIKATPQKLIAQGTDWRFLNELKKELKA